MELIDRLISDPDSLIHYMLSKNEIDELCHLFELRKEEEKHEEARS